MLVKILWLMIIILEVQKFQLYSKLLTAWKFWRAHYRLKIIFLRLCKFLVWISMPGQWKPSYYRLPTYNEWWKGRYQWNPFWALKIPFKLFFAVSNVWKLKNYLLNSILNRMGQKTIGFILVVHLIFSSEDALCWKSSYVQIWGIGGVSWFRGGGGYALSMLSKKQLNE